MEYKLAKQLKEARFPQKLVFGDKFYYQEGQDGLWDDLKQDIISTNAMKEEWLKLNPRMVKIPTLSELIEATKQKGRELSFDECNEQWGSKYNHDKGIFERDENGKVIEELKSPYQWEAKLEDWNSKEYGKRRCYKAGDEVVTFTGGKTPEEAVARLYIKLNEK